MSTPLLKLYKGSYTSAQLLEKCTEGAIVFDNSTHRIYAGTDSNKPVMFGSNIQDVDFTSNILKIWKTGDAANEPSIKLDFSDIASATSIMAVFTEMANKMGLTGQNHDQIDYSGTNYLSDLGTSGKPDKNLVNADKALDAAIKNVADTINGLDVTEYEQGVVDTTTSQTETTVKIKSIKEEDGKIAAGTSTTDIKLDGTYNPSTNKVATQSTVTNAVKKAADSSATYDTTASEISQNWIGVVEANEIKQGDTFEADIDKLDTKIAGLADELIKDEQVINTAVNAIADSVGLKDDLSLDLSDVNLKIIKNDASVKEALVDLDAAFAEAGKVDDVKINGTTIVANKNANIAVDGTYDATNNKIATESTVSGAINALDVTTDKGGASVSGSTITITGVQQEDGLIKNGGSTTINLDGTYDATDNKIATKSTVTTAIEALDGSATIASKSGNVVTIKTGVTEADGVISNDSGTDIVLEEVAVTGAAADVSIADAEGKITATTVEGALTELAKSIEALQGAFDVVVSTDAATTPQGVSWGSVVGTLVASADTFHKIYLVPAGGTTPNTYSEYITTRTGAEGSYTYGWEKLGDIAVDLTGYVKTITVNGKAYAVDSNSTNISLGDVITSIVGETAIADGDANVVSVEATTVKDSANGTNVTTLASKVKIEEVADGIVKDNTPVYSADHYVIENGKLVSAYGKSSGDTYTISANDGLVKASDVKAYVDSSIADSGFRWSEWS